MGVVVGAWGHVWDRVCVCECVSAFVGSSVPGVVVRSFQNNSCLFVGVCLLLVASYVGVCLLVGSLRLT